MTVRRRIWLLLSVGASQPVLLIESECIDCVMAVHAQRWHTRKAVLCLSVAHHADLDVVLAWPVFTSVRFAITADCWGLMAGSEQYIDVPKQLICHIQQRVANPPQ